MCDLRRVPANLLKRRHRRALLRYQTMGRRGIGIYLPDPCTESRQLLDGWQSTKPSISEHSIPVRPWLSPFSRYNVKPFSAKQRIEPESLTFIRKTRICSISLFPLFLLAQPSKNNNHRRSKGITSISSISNGSPTFRNKTSECSSGMGQRRREFL